MQESNMTGEGNFAGNPRITTRTVQTDKTSRRGVMRDLTLTGEVTLSVIKEPGSSFAADGDGETFSGSLLHISEDSALIETSELVAEGALLSVCVFLESSQVISDTLGLVMRIDQEDDVWIMGLSFVGRDQLADILAGAELELLDKRFGHFSSQIKCMLMHSELNGREDGEGN